MTLSASPDALGRCSVRRAAISAASCPPEVGARMTAVAVASGRYALGCHVPEPWGGGEETEAPHTSLASAYTPLGNAAFRWGAPSVPGPGLGETDVGLTVMQSFISAQASRASLGEPSSLRLRRRPERRDPDRDDRG